MFNTVEKRRRRVSNKQKQTKNNIDWSEYASTLAKALCASNKGINSREDFNVLIRSQIFSTS
jgi:hypothetical protein